MPAEMIEATDHVCPRCLGAVPRAGAVGEYPGALSRADNEHEVCSGCGVDEALHGVVPVAFWPVLRWTTNVDNALRWVKADIYPPTT